MLLVFLRDCLVFVCFAPVKSLCPECVEWDVKPTGSALSVASDIHRQVPTNMAGVRHDWLTNQNTD